MARYIARIQTGAGKFPAPPVWGAAINHVLYTTGKEDLRETEKARRPDLAALFKNHIGLRTCIDGILQGRFGQIRTDGEPAASA